tara:strand:+ start:708 stop:896 length:189 start_codon:yes stop_codon:yes gene_type:complete
MINTEIDSILQEYISSLFKGNFNNKIICSKKTLNKTNIKKLNKNELINDLTKTFILKFKDNF